MNVSNSISGSSAFSKYRLYIWKSLVHVLLKPSLKDFEHNLTGMWNECKWTFFGIAFLWDWKARKSDAFRLWCWRRLLRVTWTARRLNQSILKEINPEHSLEGLMLKLKLQYFGHLIWKTYSLEKILMMGKIEGKMWRGWQRMRWSYSIIYSMDMNLNKLQEIVEDKRAWCAAVHGVTKSWTPLNDYNKSTFIFGYKL